MWLIDFRVDIRSSTRTLPPPSNWCGTPPTPKHFTNGLRGRDSGFWVWGGDKGATPRVRCPQAEWHTQLCKHRVPQHAASSTSCPNACKKSRPASPNCHSEAQTPAAAFFRTVPPLSPRAPRSQPLAHAKRCASMTGVCYSILPETNLNANGFNEIT